MAWSWRETWETPKSISTPEGLLFNILHLQSLYHRYLSYKTGMSGGILIRGGTTVKSSCKART